MADIHKRSRGTYGMLRIRAALRLEVTADTVERLAETKQWAKLSEGEREDLRERLAALEGSTATEKAALAKKLGAVPKGVEKQLWATLGVYTSIPMTSIRSSNGPGTRKAGRSGTGDPGPVHISPQLAEPS